MKALVLGDTTPVAKALIAALIACSEFSSVTLLAKERNRMWAELAGASEKLTCKVIEFDALASAHAAFADVDVVFCCLDAESEKGDSAVVVAAQLCKGSNVEHYCPIIGSAPTDCELPAKALETLHQRLLHFLLPHVSLWHVATKKKTLLLSPRRAELVIEPRVLAPALLECALAYRDRISVESAPSSIYDQSCALAFSKLYEERLLRLKDPQVALSPRSMPVSPRSPRASAPAPAPNGTAAGDHASSSTSIASAASTSSVALQSQPIRVPSAAAAVAAASAAAASDEKNGVTSSTSPRSPHSARRRHHRRHRGSEK
jgi:hypothetical protein